MDRSKLKRLGFLLVIAAGISVLPINVAGAAGHNKIRWDIISVDFATTPFTVSAGGHAMAIANDGTSITLTGSGTFRGNSGNPQNVTGGGTWETFAEDGVTVTGSGIYKVSGLVSFVLAPAPNPPAPLIDNVCSDCVLTPAWQYCASRTRTEATVCCSSAATRLAKEPPSPSSRALRYRRISSTTGTGITLFRASTETATRFISCNRPSQRSSRRVERPLLFFGTPNTEAALE